MVAKISHGASLYGALAYNFGKVAEGTASILTSYRVIGSQGDPSADGIHLAMRSFENYLLANQRTEKPVLHIALSPAPEDSLTDGQLARLAESYMQKMGYGDQPYIAYKHTDTHNVHLHIVSLCVDEQGHKISDRYEHRRSMAACRELEQAFGLRNGAESIGRTPPNEFKKVNASEGDVRHQIGNVLKTVLAEYRFQTFGEYNALLSTFNIEVRQVRGEYQGTPYTGIVYAATDDEGKVISPPFKSARFGKRFGSEGLAKRMQSHIRDYKAGRWRADIRPQISAAIQQAASLKELEKLLKANRIDVVFRRNESGRIYGVTFIDHGQKEVFNGSRLGKDFSANAFNTLFAHWEGTLAEATQTAEQFRHSHKTEQGILEQAAGILSMDTNPTDYEEEAFARRMKRKKKAAKRKSRGI